MYHLQTLVDGAPHAFGADWAALVEFGPDGAPSGVLAAQRNLPIVRRNFPLIARGKQWRPRAPRAR